MWTYLPYGPFPTETEYTDWLQARATESDPLFFTVIDLQRDTGPAGAVGLVAYLRITPLQGCIEVGHLAYSPLLQRSPAATEAMYLMMRQAFDLGYRRYEWKCDSLNAPSRAAALRLGFTFEGLFRQATVVRGRNRDTTWFSVIDSEWPTLRTAFERWLDPTNFDATGRQRASLASFRTG
jgi:RimJ/RimL family protein N-acetyltransferase